MIETAKKLSPKELLEKYLATHNVPIAKTVEELYSHSVVDDNGEEIDDFLRLREEWREEDKKLSAERKENLER